MATEVAERRHIKFDKWAIEALELVIQEEQ